MIDLDYNILIERIRKEANDVKNCFTTFSFQAIAFSGVVLAGIAAYQPNQPFVGFASIFIVVTVVMVSKIGNYKYATANRHFGFELYLDSKNLTTKAQEIEQYEIGWEQALRAWRVVQASIFDKLYYTTTNTSKLNIIKRLKFNQIKKEHKKPESGWWFEPDEMIKGKGARWYPGRYLKSMQRTLLLFAYLCLIPLILIPFQFEFMEFSKHYPFSNIQLFKINYIVWITGLVTIISSLALLYKIREINARRRLLEYGILSIHSCAIMWEVVVLAHNRAFAKAKENQSLYLKCLSDEAEDIQDYVYDINKWIEKVKNTNSA